MQRLAVLVCAAALVAYAAATASPSPLEAIFPAHVWRWAEAMSLSASPSTGVKHADYVNVTWSGVANPSQDDWIGAYLVGDDVSKTAPIKYQFASFSPSHLSKGAGTISFRLMNMRDNYVFYFFRNGTEHPQLASTSNTVHFANLNEPLQGRIAYTGVPGQMMVSWTTKDSSSPTVRYGFSSGQLDKKVAAKSYTYTRDQMCGAPATTVGYRDAGTFHSAVITGLAPSQKVYYQFGDDTNGFSKQYSFVAAPEAGNSVNMIAFGDLGQHTIDGSLQEADMKASLNTTNAIQADMDGKDLVLHIGDISYARGYMSQWDQFHDQIEPISTALPWMTAIGNHERDWPGTGTIGTDDSGGECGVAYETRFPMPTPGKDKPWYSFDYGVLHILLMSTEQDFSPTSEQYAFFKKDLESVNRTKTPWVIFAGHRPFYIDSTNESPGWGDQPVAREMRKSFEELLYQHKVDLIFGAHHHSYQRTCPVYKNQCQKPGPDGYAAPIIVDIGMAGYDNSENIEHKRPDIFQVVDDTHHGYTRISATSSKFYMEYVRGDDRQVHDHFVLTKN